MEKIEKLETKSTEEIEQEINNLTKDFFAVLKEKEVSEKNPITIEELIKEPEGVLNKVMAKYELEDFAKRTLARMVEKILKLKKEREKSSIHYNPS